MKINDFLKDFNEKFGIQQNQENNTNQIKSCVILFRKQGYYQRGSNDDLPSSRMIFTCYNGEQVHMTEEYWFGVEKINGRVLQIPQEQLKNTPSLWALVNTKEMIEAINKARSFDVSNSLRFFTARRYIFEGIDIKNKRFIQLSFPNLYFVRTLLSHMQEYEKMEPKAQTFINLIEENGKIQIMDDGENGYFVWKFKDGVLDKNVKYTKENMQLLTQVQFRTETDVKRYYTFEEIVKILNEMNIQEKYLGFRKYVYLNKEIDSARAQEIEEQLLKWKDQVLNVDIYERKRMQTKNNEQPQTVVMNKETIIDSDIDKKKEIQESEQVENFEDVFNELLQTINEGTLNNDNELSDIKNMSDDIANNLLNDDNDLPPF